MAFMNPASKNVSRTEEMVQWEKHLYKCEDLRFNPWKTDTSFWEQ